MKALPLAFGTMRMLENDKSIEEWVEYFQWLFENNIRWLHSSSEYESFDLFCSVMAELSKVNDSVKFRHIVKLAEPHFQDKEFNGSRLLEKIEFYLDRLNLQKIDILQWMWRADLKNSPRRVADFIESSADMRKCVFDLKKIGLIDKFHCFPYTTEFASVANDLDFVDGLVLYRNKWETEFDEFFSIHGSANDVVTLRPFAAGKGFQQGCSAQTMINYALEPENVSCVVFTSSSTNHVQQFLGSIK